MKIGCVLLAAGNARRFGSNKLQVQVDGESLIRRIVGQALGRPGAAIEIITP